MWRLRIKGVEGMEGVEGVEGVEGEGVAGVLQRCKGGGEETSCLVLTKSILQRISGLTILQ